MKTVNPTLGLLISCLALLNVSRAGAQDWPQWRGPNRDGKADSFTAPKTWPKELKKSWTVPVGEGVATPALANGKLYVFARQNSEEILRCLDAATGSELWQSRYDSLGATGPAQGFSGPRSSPIVSGGKVVTVGVRGMISCLNAADGKVLWRKDEFQAWPNFFVSSSPLIVDGLCIAQLGGRENGALIAYDLASGNQKWKWSGPSPTYSSPALMTVADTKLIIAQTESKVVAVRAADGTLACEALAQGGGGGPGGGGGGKGGGPRDYKAGTPIVDGQTLIIAGLGVTALKIEKQGDGFAAKELWRNAEKSAQFNTPVLKSGLLYGLTGANELFCLNSQSGQTAWRTPLARDGGAGEPKGPPERKGPPPDGKGFGGKGPGGKGFAGKGFGGGGGGRGYGSIVDAGSVLLALTPAKELIAFGPGDKFYFELARIKVADSDTYAHPVVSGNRVFIKDRENLSLLTLQ